MSLFGRPDRKTRKNIKELNTGQREIVKEVVWRSLEGFQPQFVWRRLLRGRGAERKQQKMGIDGRKSEDLEMIWWGSLKYLLKYVWKEFAFIKRIFCMKDQMCRCLEHPNHTPEFSPKTLIYLTITLTIFGSGRLMSLYYWLQFSLHSGKGALLLGTI